MFYSSDHKNTRRYNTNDCKTVSVKIVCLALLSSSISIKIGHRLATRSDPDPPLFPLFRILHDQRTRAPIQMTHDEGNGRNSLNRRPRIHPNGREITFRVGEQSRHFVCPISIYLGRSRSAIIEWDSIICCHGGCSRNNCIILTTDSAWTGLER